MPNRVLLVRHALTDFDIASSEGRFCGRSDPDLNDRGVLEAQELGRQLQSFSFSEVICSPLARSIQTAQHALPELIARMKVDDRLAEIDYGLWDGLTKGEIQSKSKTEFQAFEKDPFTYHPTGSESVNTLVEIAWKWLSERQSELCLAFSHKTWTRLLLCRLLGIPLQRYRSEFDIKIASVTCLLNVNGKWRLEALNYMASTKRIIGSARPTE